MAKPAVLVFAKAPVPGYCKTRMQPDLSPEQSADVQDAMFRDVMALEEELHLCMNVEFWVAYTPTDCAGYFNLFTSRLIPQEGKDLGERIKHGLRQLFNRGYGPVVIIGTDTPLCSQDLIKAFQILEEALLVIGPTLDGGYYLLGMHEYEPLLFAGISWGTDKVLNQTCRQAKELNHDAKMLDFKRDIDEASDLLDYWNKETICHFEQWKKLLNWY